MSILNHHSIYKAFESMAQKHANKPAVVFLGSKFTYATIRELAERTAASFSAMGIGKGDRIVMYIPNSIQFIVTWLGIQRLGAIAVPITPIYTAFDLGYIVRDTEAAAVVCSDRNFGYVKQVFSDSSLKQAVVSNVADLLPWWKRAFGYLADKVPAGKVERSDTTTSLSTMVSARKTATTWPISS